MSLDPQAELFLQEFNQQNPLSISEMSLEDLRSRVVPCAGPLEPIARIDDLVVPSAEVDISVKVYHPQLAEGASPKAAIVYFHGGGWVSGSIKAYDHLCCALSHRSESVVVSVEYRCAPEHPFPAPFNDCYVATEWVSKQLANWGIPVGGLMVMGDSAGGNLAAAVCLKSKREVGPQIQKQVLLYPITDYNLQTASYTENATGYMLTQASMAWFWDQYVPNEDERSNPYVSPLRADDLSELPAAYILTCGYDPLRDEGIDYGKKLQSQGVSVELIHCPGMLHGFIRRFDSIDLALIKVQEIAEFIKA